MTINQRMFEILNKKGLKQKDLAEYLGVNQSVTTNWKMRGNNPPAELLIPICEFLNINIYELLGVENTSQSELERIYKKLQPEDKQIIDIIISKYKNKENLLSNTKIS